MYDKLPLNLNDFLVGSDDGTLINKSANQIKEILGIAQDNGIDTSELISRLNLPITSTITDAILSYQTNKYRWNRYDYVYSVPILKNDSSSTCTILSVPSTSASYNDLYVELYVSDSCYVSSSDGKIYFYNGQYDTIKITKGSSTTVLFDNKDLIIGKYIKFKEKSSTTNATTTFTSGNTYYCSPDAVITTTTTKASIASNGVKLVTPSTDEYASKLNTGVIVSSNTEERFPVNGKDGDYWYTYIDDGPEIELGSYIGTGTNNVSISLSFSPDIVFVMHGDRTISSNLEGYKFSFGIIDKKAGLCFVSDGYTGSSVNSPGLLLGKVYCTDSSKEFKWASLTRMTSTQTVVGNLNSYTQYAYYMNNKDSVYKYIAIRKRGESL